jgi:hypothetical protein
MPLGETTQRKLFSCVQFEKLNIGCPRNCLVQCPFIGLWISETDIINRIHVA